MEASSRSKRNKWGAARREEPVYAGFELELAGAERYRTADQTRHRGIYLFPCLTLDRPRQLPIGEENENRWCLWRPDELGLDSRSIFEGALVEE